MKIAYQMSPSSVAKLETHCGVSLCVLKVWVLIDWDVGEREGPV
jgi:hypothetical protein